MRIVLISRMNKPKCGKKGRQMGFSLDGQPDPDVCILLSTLSTFALKILSIFFKELWDSGRTFNTQVTEKCLKHPAI